MWGVEPRVVGVGGTWTTEGKVIARKWASFQCLHTGSRPRADLRLWELTVLQINPEQHVTKRRIRPGQYSHLPSYQLVLTGMQISGLSGGLKNKTIPRPREVDVIGE